MSKKNFLVLSNYRFLNIWFLRLITPHFTIFAQLFHLLKAWLSPFPLFLATPPYPSRSTSFTLTLECAAFIFEKKKSTWRWVSGVKKNHHQFHGSWSHYPYLGGLPCRTPGPGTPWVARGCRLRSDIHWISTWLTLWFWTDCLKVFCLHWKVGF